MSKSVAFPAFAAIILVAGQVWAQYGPPPVIGRRAAAADTGGVGSYGDTMDEAIGNGTRTYWGMGRGLSGDATLGSGVNGYSAMGIGGHGQTTGAGQLVPYYSPGASAGDVNYGNEHFGLGGTPGFGRLWSGPTAGASINNNAATWPSSYASHGTNPRLIPREHVQGIMRVTRTPYAPPGNPGFVDPGVAARANEYTTGSTSVPQTQTGSRSAYPPAPAPAATAPQPPK